MPLRIGSYTGLEAYKVLSHSSVKGTIKKKEQVKQVMDMIPDMGHEQKKLITSWG